MLCATVYRSELLAVFLTQDTQEKITFEIPFLFHARDGEELLYVSTFFTN